LNKAKEDIEKKTQKLNDNIKTYAVQHNSNSLRFSYLELANIYYEYGFLEQALSDGFAKVKNYNQ
jgi:uncharacterized membrane protein